MKLEMSVPDSMIKSLSVKDLANEIIVLAISLFGMYWISHALPNILPGDVVVGGGRIRISALLIVFVHSFKGVAYSAFSILLIRQIWKVVNALLLKIKNRYVSYIIVLCNGLMIVPYLVILFSILCEATMFFIRMAEGKSVVAYVPVLQLFLNSLTAEGFLFLLLASFLGAIPFFVFSAFRQNTAASKN